MVSERIKIFEGYSEKPYKCTAGKWTIGYGYNYDDRGFPSDILNKILLRGFDRAMAEELLARDVASAVASAEGFPFFDNLNGARQAVIVDMIYQLGLDGFRNFKRMIMALNSEDYERAAAEMMHSKWFSQSGRRSVINVAQMKIGIFQEVR